MTNLQLLKSLTAYPIPSATLQSIAEGSGLVADEEIADATQQSTEQKRAIAKVYTYLITAPNVSQNGISFSFSAEERKRFRTIAKAYLDEIGDNTALLGNGNKYGYVGEDF